MIKYIKYHLVFFLLFLGIFSTIIYFYQDQDVNISALKDESNSLEVKLNSLKKDLVKAKKELKKNNEFLNNHKNLKIIDKPKTLDVIKTEQAIQNYLDLYFEGASISFAKKSKNSKSKEYILYKAKLSFSYKSNYDLKKIINYISNNYMIQIDSFSYSSKNKKFKLELYFVGKKGKDIFSKKSSKRRGR
jgi:hypothetical protein